MENAFTCATDSRTKRKHKQSDENANGISCKKKAETVAHLGACRCGAIDALVVVWQNHEGHKVRAHFDAVPKFVNKEIAALRNNAELKQKRTNMQAERFYCFEIPHENIIAIWRKNCDQQFPVFLNEG